MIQVQRFNKVLKLAVILGDLVILNVLFISFNSIWNELFGERTCSGTLPQILTLFSVCYFACTISGGVILHRRGARADQIVFRVLRNVFYFSFLSTGLMVLSELEIYSKRFFIYYFILLILCITVYRLLFRFCIQLYRSHGGNFRTVLYLGSTENIAELFRHHPQCQIPRQLYLSGKTGASYQLPGTAQGEPALLLPALGIERTDRAGHQLLREQPDTFLQRAQCTQLPAPPHAL